MPIDLPYNLTLRDYQRPVWQRFSKPLESGARGITVWPRRNGKDLIALNIATAQAFQRTGLYLYVAPFYTQIRNIIWEGMDHSGRSFLDYIPPNLIKKKNKTDMRVTLVNNSQLKFGGSDNIDSVVGGNPLGIIFTEFSLHKIEAWNYLRPILADNGGWALFNGTPRGLNHMYQIYKLAEKHPKWFVQYLTRDDTGHPTLEAIQEDRETGMPESLIEQEYYCSWTSSSEEVLIPLDVLEPAIHREVNPEHVQNQPRILGVDVAFAEKGDEATIAKRQGTLLHPLEVYQGLDNMVFASRIATVIREWYPNTVFIDAGRGEGVISRLNQLGFGDIIVPVHFGGKVFSDLYRIKKDEMWCNAKVWLTDPTHYASIPDDETLITQLSAPTFHLNDRGFIEVETKKHLKSRGIPSTDRADAFVLTFAELVDGPVLTDGMIRHGVTQEILDKMSRFENHTPYNPLKHMEQYSNNGWGY